MASKKKKIAKRKEKRESSVYILSVKRNIYYIFYIQEVISTPYIVFTKAKACDWLLTRIRKEITSKNT